MWSHVDTATLAVRHVLGVPSWTTYLREVGDRVARTVGGYEIEGRGIQLFERVDGDMFTIIGLPLLPLLAELRARGAIEA